MYNCRQFYRKFRNFENLLFSNENVSRKSKFKLQPPRQFSSIQKQETEYNKKSGISSVENLILNISKGRRINLKHVSQFINEAEPDKVSEDHILFLMECCGKATGEKFSVKHKTCQEILQKFQVNFVELNKIYERYINVCTDNKQILDVDLVIKTINKNMTLNILKLLLKNVCERGAIEKALRILTQIKEQGYSADEEIFNDLVLCHTIEGGLTLGKPVLKTMALAKINETNQTRFAIIKGLSQRKDLKEFIRALDEFPVKFDEKMTLDLLDSLGFSENNTWIKHIEYLKYNPWSRQFYAELEKLCTNLVHNEKYDAAMEIYKTFVEHQPDVRYGANLLREMLICSTPIKTIAEFCTELKRLNLNEYALQDVTELALKYRLTVSAIQLLKYFDVLRPHYFWPIIRKASASGGEKAIMEVVKHAEQMNVKFDSDSLQDYIFPSCDLSDPQRIIKILQTYGYTVRNLLTPMLVTLLRKNETKLALELCNSYNVQIGSDDLLEILPYSWINTTDIACLGLIQKISECQNEYLLGNFLLTLISVLKNPSKLQPLLKLLKESKNRKLLIDPTTSDSLINNLKQKFSNCRILPELENAINDLLDLTKLPETSHVLHPRDMDTEQLECHLVELKSRNMETRGVLRKLIQKHTNEGNLRRVEELENELKLKQYNLSPGTISNIMYSHVKKECLNEALKTYEDLKNNYPNFKVDVFKIIDLATILVKNEQYDKAFEILLQEAQHGNQPGKYERNCKALLSSMKDMKKQWKMFEFLMGSGYCAATNIVLGSIIELHLEKDNLENTVNLYMEFVEKYRKTPMQLVLLVKTLECENQELLQKVLEATAQVHGNVAAHSALISALCEEGYTKQIIAILQNTQLDTSREMEKRCERWVAINQMEPLRTLLEVSRDVSSKLLNQSKIQLSIMQLYSKNNDCEGAVEFWKTLKDNDEFISTEVDMEFCNLLKRCKYELPKNLNLKYRVK